ncbi:MAG TPA: DNA polymerase domain-containing protein [Candidatus Acidoferrales bacterium]|nr:DNA polymerase domain-containing protein [Candidatus Acidoferrales bacterium]
MRLQGWILDLYSSPQGMVLWLLTPNQTRHKLIDVSFQPAFYVHTQERALEQLAHLVTARFRAHCRLAERRDIWQAKPLRVLEVTVCDPLCFRPAVHFVQRAKPEARLYDSDLMLPTLYCWQKHVFPLARVEAETGIDNQIVALACTDDPWALTYELPPLRIMQLRLAGLSHVNPAHGRRGALEVEADGETHVLDDSDISAAANVARLLKRYDPDLLLSEWGDSTIMPLLLQQAERYRIPLNLNRDPDATVERSRARSFMSYGRILFKDSSTTLFGRLHVDAANSFMADKCQLDGLWELVRVTKLPVQYASRTTPGTGISYMQMELAWRDGVLIPAQKAEPEDLKSPDELLAADRGGLVFTPKLGFFENVAELDFVSEYPSIMARFNISPETVNCPCCPGAPRVPELGYRICEKRQGITSRVVGRLIEKRGGLKRLAHEAPADSAQRYKLQREALKWLLVCCFGYTGYKNARFGKIEAHEAINAVAREKLLVAKEIAEKRGFELLHALVDSLYVRKPNATPEDYETLACEIERQTRLPMAVEAVYRYIVFLPSKQFASVPVPNRFFAVRADGELKVRGLECRRHDTPPLVSKMQKEALTILSEAEDFESYTKKLEMARAILTRYLERVEEGDVMVEDLVISKRLTRSPRDYQKASLTAIAAQQLFGREVKLRPGQVIEYVITDAEAAVPNDRVRAYALWEGWRGYDRKKYREMLRGAFDLFLKPCAEIPRSIFES